MPILKICTGRSCDDHGSKYLFDRAQAEAENSQWDLTVESCNCLGQCEQAPNVKLGETIHSQMSGPKLAHLLKSKYSWTLFLPAN